MEKKSFLKILNRKKLKDILKNFHKKKILVIGDIILDRFIWGDVSRISPEAPVPVVEVRDENFLPGGAGNVALNVKSLGGEVFLIGGIGKDKNGELLKKLTEEKGIKTLFIKRDVPTITKTRVIGKNQQIVRIDREERKNISEKEFGEVVEKIEVVKDKIDGIIVSDYGKGFITKKIIEKLISIKNKRDIVLSVDPKIQHFKYYKNVTCITPNKKEAAEGMQRDIPENKKEIINLGKLIKKKLKCESLIITLGKEGMILFSRNNNIFHVPSVAKDVYDVTGAGDTVIASFTLSYVETYDEIISSIISDFAAGIVVGKMGTAVVEKDELEKFFEKNSNSGYIEIIK